MTVNLKFEDCERNRKTATYRGECCVTRSAIDFFGELPGVQVKQCSKYSLRDFGHSNQQLGLCWQAQTTEMCHFCRHQINTRKYSWV